MTIKLKHLAVAAVAASLSTVALAGEDKAHGDAMSAAPDFSQLDSDSDGLVSRSELRDADANAHTDKLSEKWSELDIDQDGELDRSEFARFEPTMEGDSGADTGFGTDREERDTGTGILE